MKNADIKDLFQSLASKVPDHEAPLNYRRSVTFDNGYGASIVCNTMSYGGGKGLFEVAVIKNGELCYTTPITSDVVGYCDFAEVAEILEKIKNLPTE